MTTHAASPSPTGNPPAHLRLLTALMVAAVAVSLVHYTDSVVAFAEYPKSSTLPNPSASLIGASWFVFTGLGAAGYLEYRRSGPSPRAALLLAAYSGSGLIGLLHYSVPGALDMPLRRHAHVLADIILGAAILAFAVWTARQPNANR